MLFLIVTAAAQSQAVAQAQVEGIPKAADNAKLTALPDLIVTGITYEANNKVRVRVLNQGKGSSARCYLALMMLSGGGPASAPQKVWTIEVPPLAAGKGFSMPISIRPKSWVDAAFKARVDRSDSVREIDESNNDLFNDSKVVK
jgi:hypothetical protein